MGLFEGEMHQLKWGCCTHQKVDRIRYCNLNMRKQCRKTAWEICGRKRWLMEEDSDGKVQEGRGRMVYKAQT